VSNEREGSPAAGEGLSRNALPQARHLWTFFPWSVAGGQYRRLIDHAALAHFQRFGRTLNARLDLAARLVFSLTKILAERPQFYGFLARVAATASLQLVKLEMQSGFCLVVNIK
jgi:hypothetical protein